MRSRESFDGRHKKEPDPENNKSLDWGVGDPDPSTPFADWTESEANTLQEYIWTIRDMLGLNHWDVYLAGQYSEETAMASVHPLYGRHVAAVYINRNWFSYTPEDQRNVMVHEMLHVVHNTQTDIVRVGYSSTMPSEKTANSMWTLFERETELMVDHLANMIAGFFPLMRQGTNGQ